ncbi:unnamed protein product [Arabidopsis lyrata]|nr:unnamed protein product [Arabidopsis lyrata]
MLMCSTLTFARSLSPSAVTSQEGLLKLLCKLNLFSPKSSEPLHPPEPPDPPPFPSSSSPPKIKVLTFLPVECCLAGLTCFAGDSHFSPSSFPPHKLIYVVGFTVVPSGVLSSVFTDFFPRLYSFTEKPSSFTERPSSFTERPSSFMERSLPPISSSLERTLPSSSFLKERPFSSFLFYMKSVCQSSAFMAFRA